MAAGSQLILSTGNVMNNASTILRRPATQKSNVELVNSLRSNLTNPETSLAQSNGQDKSEESVSFSRRDNVLFMPRLEQSPIGLMEESHLYDITAKLFFLSQEPFTAHSSHLTQAVNLVLEELKVPSISLIILSFPGVSFDDSLSECDDPLSIKALTGKKDDVQSMAQTWKTLELMHTSGLAQKIGLAEFGQENLERFLAIAQTRPAVDQINLRDCCELPRELVQYAKDQSIELLTHSDCTNILPLGTLQSLLEDCSSDLGPSAGERELSALLKTDLVPRWVVKYTAVIRDRGVVENKGYFAMAEPRVRMG